MRTCAALVLGMPLVFAALPASGADHAYSGYFTPAPPEKSLEDAQSLCVTNFFAQEKDGSYITYHLDTVAYFLSGAIRFVEYNRGRCAGLPGGKVEVCTSTFDTNPAEIGKTYIDVPSFIGTDVIETSYFDTMEEAQSFALNGGDTSSGAKLHFNRCLDFDAAKMTKYITTEHSALSPEQITRLMTGDLDAETISIAAEVRKKIHADKKE